MIKRGFFLSRSLPTLSQGGENGIFLEVPSEESFPSPGPFSYRGGFSFPQALRTPFPFLSATSVLKGSFWISSSTSILITARSFARVSASPCQVRVVLSSGTEEAAAASHLPPTIPDGDNASAAFLSRRTASAARIVFPVLKCSGRVPPPPLLV